jgi:hypothetical protein
MTNDEAGQLLDNLGLGPARPKPARLDAFHAALGTETIRHMDWNPGSFSATAAWQEHKTQTAAALQGIDWSEHADLPNGSYVMDGLTFQIRGDAIWVSAPALATDEYMRRLADLAAAFPDQRVYVEYGNEDLSHLWFADYTTDETPTTEGLEVTEIVLPEIPPPCWDERPISPEACRAATKAMCG